MCVSPAGPSTMTPTFAPPSMDPWQGDPDGPDSVDRRRGQELVERRPTVGVRTSAPGLDAGPAARDRVEVAPSQVCGEHDHSDQRLAVDHGVVLEAFRFTAPSFASRGDLDLLTLANVCAKSCMSRTQTN